MSQRNRQGVCLGVVDLALLLLGSGLTLLPSLASGGDETRRLWRMAVLARVNCFWNGGSPCLRLGTRSQLPHQERDFAAQGHLGKSHPST